MIITSTIINDAKPLVKIVQVVGSDFPITIRLGDFLIGLTLEDAESVSDQLSFAVQDIRRKKDV